MPICPKCGSPRIDRYCSQCGAAATKIVDKRYASGAASTPVPAPPRPVQRRKSGGGLVIALLLLFGMVFGILLTAHTSPRASPTRITTFPQMPGGDMASYIRDFESDADMKISMGRLQLSSAVGQPSILDGRLSGIKSEVDKVSSMRENMARALQRTRLENAWPVEISGYQFSRPGDLQAAIESADKYLRQGAAAESELIQASDRSRRIQQAGDRLLAQMQQIRTDLHLIAVGQKSSDMVSLREKHAKFAELNAELSGETRGANNVDWGKANLAPFNPN